MDFYPASGGGGGVSQATLDAHTADTTAVHGITDTGLVIESGDAAGGVLSGTFPNPGFAVDMATQAELNAVAAQAAGGVLSGNYPNPGFAADMATQAELNAGMLLPVAQMSRVAAQSVNSGAETAADWDTEDFDTEGIATIADNKFTVPAGRAGIWLASIRPIWPSSATARHIVLNKNGSLWARIFFNGVALSQEPLVTHPLDLAVGDFLEWLVRQDSGGAVNFTGSAMMTFLGRRA